MTEETARNIVEMVAKETEIALTYEQIYDGNIIYARSARGGRYLIVTYWGGLSGAHIVKSLLKVVRPFARHTWLVNGQSGTNTKAIAFWSESHRYTLTLEEWVRSEIASRTKEGLLYGLDHRCIRLPAQFTEEQVRAAIDKSPDCATV